MSWTVCWLLSWNQVNCVYAVLAALRKSSLQLIVDIQSIWYLCRPRWPSGLSRQKLRSWRRSRVRIPVSPSFFRECPEEKPREKLSRIVNERERDDVDIRSTGCKDDSKGGMHIRDGYEKGFGSSRRCINGERRSEQEDWHGEKI